MKEHITHTQGRDFFTHKPDYGIFTSSGLCCFSQSFSAAFMRVCQPSPVALNALITSDEYRIFTGIFGQSVTGRPLRRNFFNWLCGTNFTSSSSSNIESGSEATALRIFLSSSSVGNIVPGFNLSFDMAFNLPSVCLSQANNSAFIIVTVSKYDAVNTVIQIAKCYKSVFSVIAAGIQPDNRRFPFEEFSLSQRNTVFVLVDGVFVWIKSDFHVFIVATINVFANRLHWLTVLSYAYPAPHKTGVGIETPKNSMATQTPQASFFVSCPRASISGGQTRDVSMVALAGLPQGRPASIEAGSLNPVNVTAPIEIETSGGDSSNSMEAVTMATVPDQNPLFVCLICYFKNRLPVSVVGLYIPVAGVNPPAGFSSLTNIAGSRDISDMRFFCARNTILTRLMAGRNGGALALAGFYVASLLTPLRLATPFSSVVARLLTSNIGAANMAISARPQGHTSSHLKSVNKLNKLSKPLFVWRFFSCQQSTYHTVTATSEHEARAQLPDAPCLFAARIRTEEVRHA